MSSDNLFGAEEDVIALGEKLLANSGFGSAEDKQRYQRPFKNYQKLFRTTRRLMRLSDHNEQRLNAAADVIARKSQELEALEDEAKKLEAYAALDRFVDIETWGRFTDPGPCVWWLSLTRHLSLLGAIPDQCLMPSREIDEHTTSRWPSSSEPHPWS
jgi:hypothetical protein